MRHWTQSVYDATGIPLDEADVDVAFHDGQWWLVVHRQAVLGLGADPDSDTAVTPVIRAALALAMKARLSQILPRVQRLLEGLDPVVARTVVVSVVNAEDVPDPWIDTTEFERGWPHFLLRLSAGRLDVEVDLNPYVPDDPVDLGDVTRQAGVLLDAVRQA